MPVVRSQKGRPCPYKPSLICQEGFCQDCGIYLKRSNEVAMNKIKHDLSYNSTKLDYQALLNTSKIAVGYCMEEISKQLAHIRSRSIESESVGLSAQWLLRTAEQLVVAAETMDALNGGLDREELEIVNKPKVGQTETETKDK